MGQPVLFKRLFTFVFFVLFCGAAWAQSPEVHVVAIYEVDIGVDGRAYGPKARVFVDRPGQDVVLVLGSEETVRWFVQASSATEIVEVLIVGPGTEGTEVFLNNGLIKTNAIDIYPGYENEGSEFRALIGFLGDRYDIDAIASFQGSYEPSRDPFAVDRIVDVYTNRVDHLATHLRPEAMTDLFRQVLSQPFEPEARLTEDGFTLREKGEEFLFPLTPNVPPVPWAVQAAYDPGNRRLFAGEAWLGGFFYTYDIETDQWSAFEQPRSIEVHGTLYDAVNDRLILGLDLEHSMGQDAPPLLAELIPGGDIALLPHEPLVGFRDLYDPENDPSPMLLPIAIDGNLLLARASDPDARHFSISAHRTYVIDLATGAATLVAWQD